MSENVPRPLRKVAIADHLWDAFDEMAREMGSERDGLINQALFMFARLNGFLNVGGPAASAPGPRAVAAPAGNGFDDEPGDRTPPPAPPPPPPAARRPTVGPSGARPPPREDPPVLAKSRSPEPPPPDAFDSEPMPPQSMDNDPARIAVAQRVLETAAELESLIKGKQNAVEAPPPPPESTGAGDRALYMSTDGRELEKVVKDRFLIGRGKHCDLVINSGKVSREHAAIVREGDDFYMQDLDSSNGTWFNKQRIKRRKIEDGDEYFICSDKVKFIYR